MIYYVKQDLFQSQKKGTRSLSASPLSLGWLGEGNEANLYNCKQLNRMS
ncbi:MAG: hypothetical protein KAR14_00060 [Candidatus Aminicenantes bacterium]|nr:hypothetical protein [Candidatus Aminicenantes bacterium]